MVYPQTGWSCFALMHFMLLRESWQYTSQLNTVDFNTGYILNFKQDCAYYEIVIPSSYLINA